MKVLQRPMPGAWRAAATALLLLLAPTANAGPQAGAPIPGWARTTEAPVLARPGEWQVGTREERIELPTRPGLGGPHAGALQLRLFYPAVPASGERSVYRHQVLIAGGGSFAVEEHGLAFAHGTPLAGRNFPLVVMSHGFGGWSEHLSRLAETLASRGYVVASIDHADARFEDVAGFQSSFGEVLLRRSHDQRAVLDAFTTGPMGRDLPIDRAARAGLIGYSMGGYGGLGTAGADNDGPAAALAALPGPVRAELVAPSDPAPALGALVLLAPWGGQADSRVWSAEALATVTAPVLIIGGSNDTVVGYRGGVRWLFDGLTGTHRHLLTLREAGHNIGGNATPFPTDADPRFLSWFGDPVWRSERLNQIVAHFTVAFLDRELKGDAAAERYLDVPIADANAGLWPLAFGDQGDGEPAGDDEPGYWRGFQRGWAAGLTLEHKKENE